MIILINCPCCNEEIKIIVKDNVVESIKINSTIVLSESEILKKLKEHGIEFG